jgi:hypothetical protein
LLIYPRISIFPVLMPQYENKEGEMRLTPPFPALGFAVLDEEAALVSAATDEVTLAVVPFDAIVCVACAVAASLALVGTATIEVSAATLSLTAALDAPTSGVLVAAALAPAELSGTATFVHNPIAAPLLAINSL